MARQKQKKVEESGGGFLTTYADMVTLLMAFFVMLFAISSVEEEKFLALLQGLEDSFGNSSYQEQILSGGASLIGANQAAGSVVPSAGGAIVLVPSTPVAELAELREQAVATESIERVIEGLARSDEILETDGSALVPEEFPEVANVLDLTELRELQAELIDAAASIGLDDAVSAELRPRGLVVILSADDILFRSGSAALEPGIGQDFIGTIASVVRDIDNPIHIEGHTDDVPLDRPGYSNWNLSSDRAIAVLDVLVDVHELDSSRLRVVAFADQHPRVPNDSDEQRATNRRVEIVIGVDDDDAALVIGDPLTTDG